MEIGRLNHRITVLEHRTVRDEIGNHMTKWEEAFSLWSCVSVRSSAESDDTGVIRQVETTDFIVRMHPSVYRISSTGFRILFRGIIYDIIGITPYYDHNSYMKIQCISRKAGDTDGIN